MNLNKINGKIESLKLELIVATEAYAKRDEAIDMAIDFMANAESMWRVAKDDNRGRFQKMIFSDGISINEDLKFGTAQKGILYEEAHLLAAETKTTKKTQDGTESLMVTLPGIEPGLPG